MFEFLNTGWKAENIRYCSLKERTVQKEFYHSGNEEAEGCTSIGRKRSLEPSEEFFLVLCRMRREFAEKHVAFPQLLYNIFLVACANVSFLMLVSLCKHLKRGTQGLERIAYLTSLSMSYSETPSTDSSMQSTAFPSESY